MLKTVRYLVANSTTILLLGHFLRYVKTDPPPWGGVGGEVNDGAVFIAAAVLGASYLRAEYLS